MLSIRGGAENVKKIGLFVLATGHIVCRETGISMNNSGAIRYVRWFSSRFPTGLFQ